MVTAPIKLCVSQPCKGEAVTDGETSLLPALSTAAAHGTKNYQKC
jgi:hypothetical protein